MQRTEKRNMVDRSVAPPLQFIKALQILEPRKIVLSNGVPVYIFTGLQQDAVKIEFVFKAGKWYENKKLIAKTTSRMMKEGTEKFTSMQIAEELDYWGASIKSFSGSDTATFTFFSLNKYVNKVMPIAEEVIKRPTFPQGELNITLTNNREQLKVNVMKNDYLADRQFNHCLYGETHPYGYYTNDEDHDFVTREELAGFHKRFYNSSNCVIIVSGSVEDSTLTLLEEFFGGDDWKGTEASKIEHGLITSTDLKCTTQAKKQYQAAIRIGKLLYNKAHPQFHKMSVLNTVLGGYFGSRLMSNIREDKGYTYGIHSSLSSMVSGGYFIIGTEVGVDVRDAAVKEIYTELARLREDLIPDEELELVRNYLMGRLQSGLDGPFKVSGLFKGLLIYDLNIDYIYQLIEAIKTVTSKELRDLAIEHLNPAEMHEVVVG